MMYFRISYLNKMEELKRDGLLDGDFLEEWFLEYQNYIMDKNISDFTYEEKIYNCDMFPYNLIKRITNEFNSNQLENFDFSIKSVNSTLTDLLTIQEQIVVYMMYEENKTIYETSQILKLSEEKIDFIHNNIITKLQQTVAIDKMDVISKSKYIELQNENERLKRINSNRCETYSMVHNSFKDIPISEIKIKDLDLSVRTTNCLKRVKLYTVKDITDCFTKGISLKRFRNIGKKTIEELIIKLNELGVEIPDEYNIYL